MLNEMCTCAWVVFCEKLFCDVVEVGMMVIGMHGKLTKGMGWIGVTILDLVVSSDGVVVILG